MLKNIENLGDYDVIFLGYSIWWGISLCAVYTFLEANDFKGKLIVPFCIHERSGHSQTKDRIEKVCSGARVLSVFEIKGQSAQKLNASTKKELLAWLEKIQSNLKNAR